MSSVETTTKPPNWVARIHSRVSVVRRTLRITETTWLFLLAAVAGALAGLGSIAFHELIGVFQWFAFGTTAHAGPLDVISAQGYPTWRILIAPAAGGLVVGPIIYLFAREAKGHGVPAVIRAVHERGGRISPIVALVKTFASAITLGTGGSLGREGPVVQIGASIASGVGQLLGVTPKQMKMLAAAGAAAGLAAIFNAPLGGAFFALEVIIGSFAMEAFGPVVVASVAATVVSRAILGDAPVIKVAPYTLEHTYELLVYVVLGLVCGATSVLFTRGIAAGASVFERVKLPEWTKATFGGAAVGLMAVLYSPRVLGNGYETVDALMSNQSLEVILIVLFGAKLIATAISLGSGLSGGVFGPTLFLGAVIGAAIGKWAGFFMHVSPPAAYALVGMAAFVGGATHAPVSMVLMIFEMSDRYEIVLPLLIATSIASVVARKMYPESVDTILDAREGRRLHKGVEEMQLHSVYVREAARIGPEAFVLRSASVRDILARFVATRSDALAVVDANGRYDGAVFADRLREAGSELEAAGGAVVAADLALTDLPRLDPEDPLTEAVDAFHGTNLDAIPIVRREDGRFCGFITEGAIVAAYRRSVLHTELVSSLQLGSTKSGRIELSEGLVTEDVPVPDWLVGQTLAQARVRTRFGTSVVAVMSPGEPARMPAPEKPLVAGDVLVLIGPRAGIDALREGRDLVPST